MYWCYKSNNPIIKAEKGSKIEAYFQVQQRLMDRLLLPEGFKAEKNVGISAVGDLMPAKGIENSSGKFYAKLSPLIFNAEISIANLEFALNMSTDARKAWRLIATPEQFDTLKGHKEKYYKVFNTANNHILDSGMEGFNTTHDLLEAEGFKYVGTNRSAEDQKKGLILNANGIKFGFVSATYSHRPFPTEKDYQVNVVPFHCFQEKVDVSLLEEQIAYCRSQDCDFILLSLHWGIEFEFFPRPEQIDIAHSLCEYGADAIISHHTHNIQPFEIYQTLRDPLRRVPIFYGLGNLCSNWSGPNLALSLIINIDVVKGYIEGVAKTLINQVNVTPVLQMDCECKNHSYLQLEKLSELINSDRGESKNDYFKEAGQYADLVLGGRWRN
jgi:poly-gamma-glutamate synthesis protein (capsule biosynthesis protein)